MSNGGGAPRCKQAGHARRRRMETVLYNWVEERDVKVDGKGRPMKIYKLGVPIGEIIKHYEKEKNSEAVQAMQAIQKLKELTTA
jgi:predicted transcriptional regulator